MEESTLWPSFSPSLLLAGVVVLLIVYFLFYGIPEDQSSTPSSLRLHQLQHQSLSSRGSSFSSQSSTSSSAWLNELIAWAHAQPGIVHRFGLILANSLNEAGRRGRRNKQQPQVKTTTATGELTSPAWELSFEAPAGQGESMRTQVYPLLLEDLRAELVSPQGHLSLSGRIEAPLGADLRVHTVTADSAPQFPSIPAVFKSGGGGGSKGGIIGEYMDSYQVQLRNLRGDIDGRLACIADELFFMCCFCSRPEMDIRVTPLERVGGDSHEEDKVTQHAIEEAVRRCFTSLVLNFTLGELLYPLGDAQAGSVRNSALSLRYSGINLLNTYDSGEPRQSPNRLRVKVVRLELVDAVNKPRKSATQHAATPLAQSDGMGEMEANGAYTASVELDEPQQAKFTTTMARSAPPSRQGKRHRLGVKEAGDRNVEWDESHEFIISPSSRELLFEVNLTQQHGAGGGSQYLSPLYSSTESTTTTTTSKSIHLGTAVMGLNEMAGWPHLTQASANVPILHRLPLQRPSSPSSSPSFSNVGTRTDEVGGVLVIDYRLWHSHDTHTTSPTAAAVVNGLGSSGMDESSTTPASTTVPKTHSYMKGLSSLGTGGSGASERGSHDDAHESLSSPSPRAASSMSSHRHANSEKGGGGSGYYYNSSGGADEVGLSPPHLRGHYSTEQLGEVGGAGTTPSLTHQMSSSFHVLHHKQQHYEHKGFLDKLLPSKSPTTKRYQSVGENEKKEEKWDIGTTAAALHNSSGSTMMGVGHGWEWEGGQPPLNNKTTADSTHLPTALHRWESGGSALTSRPSIGERWMSPELSQQQQHGGPLYAASTGIRGATERQSRDRKPKGVAGIGRGGSDFFDEIRQRLVRGSSRIRAAVASSVRRPLRRAQSLGPRSSSANAHDRKGADARDESDQAFDYGLEEVAYSIPASRDPSLATSHCHPQRPQKDMQRARSHDVNETHGRGHISQQHQGGETWRPSTHIIPQDDSTFQTPSTLVLELPESVLLENGTIGNDRSARDKEKGNDAAAVAKVPSHYRYYEIPPHVVGEAATAELIRKGKKLHLHNGHTFVAVRPRGPITCAVCSRRIAGGAFTKQAYQCRDCSTVTHKNCHQLTYGACANGRSHLLPIVRDINWHDFLSNSHQMEEFISAEGL